jgi:multidrug efflux pump subunit AcrB
MTFELNSLALSDETTFQLNHPVTEMPLFAPVKKGEDPESKPVQVTVKGEASAAYRKAVDAMMKKAAKRGKRDATPDEMREQSVEFLTSLSVRIDNLTLDGEPVDTAEVFRKLYSDAKYDWVKKQVNEAIGDTASFLKR